MEIRFDPSRKARQLLSLHGVPASLLHAQQLSLKSSLSPFNIEQTNGRNRAVTPSQQLRWFRQIYDDVPTERNVVVFGSGEFYHQARVVGLSVFSRYLQYSLNYPHVFRHSRPVWYSPEAGFRSQLLVDYERGQHRAANLLLLDGIHEDMPISKIDKIHDVLRVMDDRPCVLLIHNRDPHKYCVERLGLRPNKLLFFARQAQRRVI